MEEQCNPLQDILQGSCKILTVYFSRVVKIHWTLKNCNSTIIVAENKIWWPIAKVAIFLARSYMKEYQRLANLVSEVW